MRLLKRLKRACLTFWHPPAASPGMLRASCRNAGLHRHLALLAGLQTLPRELQFRIFQQLRLECQHALASTCRAFRALWTQEPRTRGRGAQQHSPREQWRRTKINTAAARLAERVSMEILLRTVQDTAALQAHPYSVPEHILHFKLELYLGSHELDYVLSLPTSLHHQLGPAFGRELGELIAGECSEQGLNEERELLYSLQLRHHRPCLTESELDSLARFVERMPPSLRAALPREMQYHIKAAVSCSVTGSAGPRISLFWEPVECHTFYGSNLLDGGAL